MFVRKRSNKSGSVSVQIIDKKAGKYRVVKHVGTAERDSIELEYLLSCARDQKVQLEHKNQPALADWLVKERHSELADFVSRFSTSNLYKAGFFEVFGLVYDQLDFASIVPNPLFKDLVVARIAKPTSKLSTYRWLRRYSGKHVENKISKDSIYRLMDQLTPVVKRKVCLHVFKRQCGSDNSINIIFFDATTLHFESFSADDFRKMGFSKVGKHRQPQIVIGLMVTKAGLPIGFEVYPGDKFDGHTIRRALQRVKQEYSVKHVVFVADSAMLSKKNVSLIQKAKFGYIMAAKIKNLNRKIQAQILDSTRYEDDCLELNIKPKTQHDYRLIVTYSEVRARKNRHDRQHQLDKLIQSMSKKQNLTKKQLGQLGKMKYLKIKGKAKLIINYEAIKQDAQWDGLKGYVTNLTNLPADKVVERYRELWQVEKAFRIAKTDLKIRPIFHYTAKRIRSHLLLVFVSLVVGRVLEQKLAGLGLGLERIIENLEAVIEVPMKDTKLGNTIVIRPEQSDITCKIYKILGLSPKTGVYPQNSR